MAVQESLKRGDGLVFDSGAPDDDEEGGTVYDIQASGRRSSTSGTCMELTFGPRQLNLRRIKVKMTGWQGIAAVTCHRVLYCSRSINQMAVLLAHVLWASEAETMMVNL